MPTRQEWMEEQAKKSGANSVVSKFGTNVDKRKVVQGSK